MVKLSVKMNPKSKKAAVDVSVPAASPMRASDGANDQAAARKLAKNKNDRTGIALRRADYKKKGLVRFEIYYPEDQLKQLFKAINRLQAARAIPGWAKRFAKVVGVEGAMPKTKGLPLNDHQLELLVGGEAPANIRRAVGA